MKHIKEVGWTALGVGLGQVVFTSAIGYFLARALHFDLATSLLPRLGLHLFLNHHYWQIASDKDDLDRLYGRISVGLLIVQDLIAMFILLFLGTVGAADKFESIAALVLGKWLLTIVGVFPAFNICPAATDCLRRSFSRIAFPLWSGLVFGLAGLLSVLDLASSSALSWLDCLWPALAGVRNWPRAFGLYVIFPDYFLCFLGRAIDPAQPGGVGCASGGFLRLYFDRQSVYRARSFADPWLSSASWFYGWNHRGPSQ